jgi:Ca2+/Na+ antiporter
LEPDEERERVDGLHGTLCLDCWCARNSFLVCHYDGLSLTFFFLDTPLHAEVLVDEVDVVLEGSGVPEKFLGVTLFALVPNTTEFMNAISFAMNGNIALR